MVINQLGNGLDNLVQTIRVPNVTDFSYLYDANKRKIDVVDGILADGSQTFFYDQEDHLTSWTSSTGDHQQWQLSDVGDWTSTSGTDGGTTFSETRQHNHVHEIVSINNNALVHDPKGNLTENPQRQASYTWDFDNRLQTALLGTTSTTATAVESGLILHWDYEQASLNPVVDQTGSGHDGTNIGGLQSSVEGPVSQAAVADGINDYLINTSIATDLNGLDAVTVAMWVQSDVTGQDRGIFFTRSPNGSDYDLGMRYDAAGWGGGAQRTIKASVRTTGGSQQTGMPMRVAIL
ncbi:MAG: hypothetical protein F6K62_27580 [Sphaerospermopsis sp. SIO1G2]|nr:hypothetical protein [Sphaerospermopsis sp. SIO1G2]